jgi:hypothetical protein
MPVHDWRKVDAGTFHAFHNAWNTHLMGRLNGGILPKGYYALAEQHVRGRVRDILTFQLPEQGSTATPSPASGNRGIALADSPPRVHRRLVADESASYRARQRTLTIRRTSGHQIVALPEIVGLREVGLGFLFSAGQIAAPLACWPCTPNPYLRQVRLRA